MNGSAIRRTHGNNIMLKVRRSLDLDLVHQRLDHRRWTPSRLLRAGGDQCGCLRDHVCFPFLGEVYTDLDPEEGFPGACFSVAV